MRLYICDVCGLDFPKRNELSAHLDEHVAAEEGDFQCEVCHRIFCNLRLFRIHKRMHYPQNKPWPCEICNKKYRYASKYFLLFQLRFMKSLRYAFLRSVQKSLKLLFDSCYYFLFIFCSSTWTSTPSRDSRKLD